MRISKKKRLRSLLALILLLVFGSLVSLGYFKYMYKADEPPPVGTTEVANITNNAGATGSTVTLVDGVPQVPKYDKFELTFDIDWTTSNGEKYDALAAEWSDTINYTTGASVLYKNLIYKASKPAPLYWAMENKFQVDQIARNKNLVYKSIKNTPTNWQIGTTYHTGDEVIYENNVYANKTATTAGDVATFDIRPKPEGTSLWLLKGNLGPIPVWQNGTTYHNGDKISFSYKMYTNTTTSVSGDVAAPANNPASANAFWTKITNSEILEPEFTSREYWLPQPDISADVKPDGTGEYWVNTTKPSVNPYWPYDASPSVDQYWTSKDASIPEWTAGKSYATTNHVAHGGKNYSSVNSYSVWTAGEKYSLHRIVMYNGVLYEMQWRNYWDQELATTDNAPDKNSTWTYGSQPDAGYTFPNMTNYRLWSPYQWTEGVNYIDGSLVVYNNEQYKMQWHAAWNMTEELTATAQNSPASGLTWVNNGVTTPLWVKSGSVYNADYEPGVAGTNWQYYWQEYDGVPVTPGVGISVDAYFTGPDGQEISTPSPAFYYQDFKPNPGGSTYPNVVNGKPVWKVRFTPRLVGNYSYRIVIKDKSGTTQYSSPQQFTVVSSEKRGFVRVSPNDTRYFETTTDVNNGGKSLKTVALNAANNVSTLASNGINVVRPWWAGGGSSGSYGISGQGGFSGSYWHGEYGGSDCGKAYCDPKVTVKQNELKPGSLFGFKIDGNGAIGVGNFGVNPNKLHKVSVTYKLSSDFSSATGAADGFSFGVSNASAPLMVGEKVPSADWQTKTFDFRTLSNQYSISAGVSNTNVTTGSVYIDSISIREVEDDGSLSSDIVVIPDLNVFEHFPQYKLFTNDTSLEEAENNNVYFSIVLEEKQDIIYSRIQGDGVAGTSADYNGYGGWGNHASRTYQEYYWRYFIARYGYSTSIFNVEFCNEGDPYNGNHVNAIQALVNYFWNYDPNRHLATGSNWASFPVDFMWKTINHLGLAQVHQYITNEKNSSGELVRYDTAAMSENFGFLYGAHQTYGINKTNLNLPTVVGETGISRFTSLKSNTGETGEEPLLDWDNNGIWFKKLAWGQINPYGTVVQYWWNQLIDKYKLYNYSKAYTNFIKDIDFSNGKYNDVHASTSDSNLRAWGQKEIDPTTKMADKAHLWIDNKPYTWKAVADNKFTLASISWDASARYSYNIVSYYQDKIYKSIKDDNTNNNKNHLPTDTTWWTEISQSEFLTMMDMTSLNPPLPPPASGTITIPNMKVSQAFKLEWWDTSQADPTKQIVTTTGTGADTVTLPVLAVSDSNGNLIIPVSNLVSDIALKISVSSVTPLDKPGVNTTPKAMTFKDSYIVTGTKSSSVTKVLVNSTQATITNDAFEATVTLGIGDNVITVIGQDNNGNTSEPVILETNRRRIGDVNGDGHINETDLAGLNFNWRKTTTNNPADFNEDETVGAADLAGMNYNWMKY